jgi:hypothetical protein
MKFEIIQRGHPYYDMQFKVNDISVNVDDFIISSDEYIISIKASEVNQEMLRRYGINYIQYKFIALMIKDAIKFDLAHTY